MRKLSPSNIISISDLNKNQILEILDLSLKIKKKEVQFDLKHKVLGLIFDKSSTRTRISFHVAMTRLNGTTIDIDPKNSQIGRGEPIKDTARVLSRYIDAVAIRTYDQKSLEEYAKWSSIPILNALTDLEHPCQILADLLTIKEEFGKFENTIVTYLGDGNNISNSLILGCAILGIQINIGCPNDFKPDSGIIEKALSLSDNKDLVKITNNPQDAVRGANVIYTDTWASMGQESKTKESENLFKDFSVDRHLIKEASNDHIILHCLPAYRGKEITDEIIESKSSRVFDQAENRLHVQQAILAKVLS